MSMNVTSFYRHALARPLDAVRRHIARNGPRASTAAAAVRGDADHTQYAEHAEHAERIASYARAGYFHMGYTLDVFHVSD